MPPKRPSRFVAYLRVSTARQGRSGLGLEAQRTAIREFLAACPGAQCLAEFVEQESGKRNDRPQLDAAILEARAYGATLLIAKLDRLSRNAHFLLGLKEAGIAFTCCDMPEATHLVVGIMAMVAEQEREFISDRTKKALAEAKKRGTKLGNPNGATHLSGRGNQAAVAKVRASANAFAARLSPVLAKLRKQGVVSASGIAAELNRRDVPTPRDGRWTARAVLNVQSRLA
jgi:DNA invertase Pin-like site-specific DNA recombinase